MKTKDDFLRIMFFVLSVLVIITTLLALTYPYFFVLDLVLLGFVCITAWFGSQNMEINREIYIKDMLKKIFY